MRLTMQYHANLIALLDLVAKKTGWADSAISRECFNYGDFVKKIRSWSGGPKSPTFEKAGELEAFLLDQLTKEEADAFFQTLKVNR